MFGWPSSIDAARSSRDAARAMTMTTTRAVGDDEAASEALSAATRCARRTRTRARRVMIDRFSDFALGPTND
jgi:hypothetical protein